MITKILCRSLKVRQARLFSGGHGVVKLSEHDKKLLMLYPDPNFQRTTHFPIENHIEFKTTQEGKEIKLYTYKSPATGPTKAVLLCLYA